MHEQVFDDSSTGCRSGRQREHCFCAGPLWQTEGFEGNLFFSPLSISSALAMTYAAQTGIPKFMVEHKKGQDQGLIKPHPGRLDTPVLSMHLL